MNRVNYHLLLSVTIVCFLAADIPFGIQYNAHAEETPKIVQVILKLEGKTVKGEPKVVSADKTFGALYEKSGVPVELKKTGVNTWNCSVLEGRQYVIGWIVKKGWFEKASKMFGYCSEPFTASNGLTVSFSPGMPAVFEYNLSNPPKDVQVIPADVFLNMRSVTDGKASFLSWGGNKQIEKPGIVRIEGLAAGTYLIFAQTCDLSKYTRSRTPFLYDRRQVEIKSGVVNRFEPVYPEIDTTVEKDDVTIRGVLYGSDGKPAGVKTVKLTPQNNSGIIPNLFYPASTTDPNGRFEFVGVRPDIAVVLQCDDSSAFLAEESLRQGSSVYIDMVLGSKTMPFKTDASIPDIVIDWKKGNSGKLTDLIGKTVVVDLWATWCVPCKRALPELNSLATEFSGNDSVVFVTLSNDSDRSVWENMVAQSGWDSLRHGWFDRKKNSFAFNKPVPYSFIIDKDGILRAAGNGLDIRRELERIAETKNPAEN